MRTFAMFLVLSLFFSVTPAQAALQGEEVSYQDSEGTVMKGYLVYDDALEGPRPGVIVVHEWWGHNDYARSRAEQLAGMGYVAFAVDMYGDGKKADHPSEAGEFSKAVMENQDTARDRFKAAMDVLEDHDLTDPTQMAAIGYCFGGSTVLNMARQGVDLNGVASFHGGLTTSTPARAGEVQAKVLVLHGADDEFISDEQIEAFKNEMEAADVDYEFVAYEGATHSFTNPQADEFAEEFGMPIGYHPEADQASWSRLKTFLEEIF